MKYFLSLFAGLCAVLFVVSCTPVKSDLMPGSTSGNRPVQIFEGIVITPIPLEVTNLQVGAHTWQGYKIAIRFTTTADITAKIIQQGYSQAPCEAENFVNTEFTFTPAWEPPMSECYTWNGLVNAWTYSGEHHLSVNRENGEVYLVGVGA